MSEMKRNREIQEELEGLSPMLSNLPKRQAFKVPEGYFSTLQHEVLNRISEITAESDAVVEKESWIDMLINKLVLVRQPRYALALASVVVLAVCSVFLLNPNSDSSGSFALQASDVDFYLQTNVDEFESSDIISDLQFSEEELNYLLAQDFKEDYTEFYLNDNLNEIDIETLEDLL